MAPSDIAISVRGLSKSYTIARNEEKHVTLAETALAWAKNPLCRPKTETFWALKDVDFDVRKGDVVGIIGRNGAGKSTLLKILSRITEPTAGEIDLYGRVGSLLEVGTGFHPELTGRENIYLNGAILGMRRSEISRQFDAIVDFAGTEKFLDTPVKHYSSGMYVRLAFAVAAHLNPEILIVDEVLAVGDAEFQKKCLGKMGEVASQQGRTVLFVSHNMQSISCLCSRAIVFEHGGVSFAGSTGEGIATYLKRFTSTPPSTARRRRPGTGEYRFITVDVKDSTVDAGETIEIGFEIERKGDELGRIYLSGLIKNQLGHSIAQLDSRVLGVWLTDDERIRGRLTVRTPWLKPGDYVIDLYLCTASATPIVDQFDGACAIHVSPLLPYKYAVPDDATAQGIVLASFDWHLSTAGLPSRISC